MVGSDYELGKDMYIRRRGTGKILGRAGGYGPGTFWYQLANAPYDDVSVPGFASLEDAFKAAVCALNWRSPE